MRFMNTYEVDEAAHRFANHPVLGPATRTLVNLRNAADANSDGWAYWPKPARAAGKLMELLDHRPHWEDPPATVEQVKAALRPIKAFRTRSGIDFAIEEPS